MHIYNIFRLYSPPVPLPSTSPFPFPLDFSSQLAPTGYTTKENGAPQAATNSNGASVSVGVHREFKKA